MTFKPEELYEPIEKQTIFYQQNDHLTPIKIATDTLYLEKVARVFFQYDAEIEDDGVAIDWCETSITFAAGGTMYIKTTDYKTLKAFGFDYQKAKENTRASANANCQAQESN